MKRRRSKNYFDLLSDYFFNQFDMDSFKNETDYYTDFNSHINQNEGRLEVTTGEDENGSWERREWVSTDGKTKMTSYVMNSSNKNEISRESIKKELKLAVENEDYELAAKLKKQLDSI